MTPLREQANELVKAMISTLAALENNIQLTNDADLKALQECQDIIQRFYNRQDLTKNPKNNSNIDKYTKKYIRLIKAAKTDQELSDIVEKIYTDGFDDGEQTYITTI